MIDVQEILNNTERDGTTRNFMENFDSSVDGLSFVGVISISTSYERIK